MNSVQYSAAVSLLSPEDVWASGGAALSLRVEEFNYEVLRYVN
jgi:hypothetical protein